MDPVSDGRASCGVLSRQRTIEMISAVCLMNYEIDNKHVVERSQDWAVAVSPACIDCVDKEP